MAGRPVAFLLQRVPRRPGSAEADAEHAGPVRPGRPRPGRRPGASSAAATPRPGSTGVPSGSPPAPRPRSPPAAAGTWSAGAASQGLWFGRRDRPEIRPHPLIRERPTWPGRAGTSLGGALLPIPFNPVVRCLPDRVAMGRPGPGRHGPRRVTVTPGMPKTSSALRAGLQVTAPLGQPQPLVGGQQPPARAHTAPSRTCPRNGSSPESEAERTRFTVAMGEGLCGCLVSAPRPDVHPTTRPPPPPPLHTPRPRHARQHLHSQPNKSIQLAPSSPANQVPTATWSPASRPAPVLTVRLGGDQALAAAVFRVGFNAEEALAFQGRDELGGVLVRGARADATFVATGRRSTDDGGDQGCLLGGRAVDAEAFVHEVASAGPAAGRGGRRGPPGPGAGRTAGRGRRGRTRSCRGAPWAMYIRWAGILQYIAESVVISGMVEYGRSKVRVYLLAPHAPVT